MPGSVGQDVPPTGQRQPEPLTDNVNPPVERTPRRPRTQRPQTRRLATRYKGGPAASAEMRRRMAAHEDRVALASEVWRLVGQEQLTVQQAGKRLGFSAFKAHKLLMEHYERLERLGLYEPNLIRAQLTDELRGVRKALRKKRGTPSAAAQIVAAIAAEAKLHGVNLQRRDAFSGDQVAALLRSVTTLILDVVQAPDLRARIAAGLRQKVGPELARLTAGAVEVATPPQPTPEEGEPHD